VLKKLIFIVGGIALVLIGVMAGAYWYFVRLPLPVTQGEIRVQGLRAPVEVLRDPWGVPHIYAQNNQDLLFAQGFVQAQDRLWQMELNRRVAAGRLSELFGPETVPVDRLMRTFGLMRAARKELAKCDPAQLELMRSFSDGVNAFMESRSNRLPLEFRLLNVHPEPWRPEDSIGWAKFMALVGAKNWQEEMVRAMLTQKLGPEKAKALFGLNRPETPAIIPSALDLTSVWSDSPLNGSGFLPSFGGASNNWVVHGSRTDTGSPLLANDMHLDVTIPSVWYEIHLVGGDFDVIGLSLPGVPLIIAGHNKDVAWGITFAYTDTQDIYLEQMNPDRPGQYLYKGKWEQLRRIEEPIRVKGEENPVKHEVLETVHGPIVSSRTAETNGRPHALSLRWCGYDPGRMIPALSDMNLARDLKEFKEAALNWPEPAINFVAADRDGEIGYVLAGRIPVRPQGHGRGPFPGWTGEHDWTGYLPANEKPFLLNPAKGFIVTANNRVAGDDYPHYLSDDYLAGYRAERIEEVLARKAKVSMEDFSALQGDFKCSQAARFMKALEGIEVQSPDATDLLTRLRSWDQVLSPESAGAAIYAVLFYRLMENTFGDELGDLAGRFFGLGLTELRTFSTLVTQSRVILTNLLSEPESPWFDDAKTPEIEDLSAVLQRSLAETAAFLKQAMGSDPSEWRWGRLHQIEFKHPLGRVKPLNKIFNLGPFESGGSFSTVWQSTFMPGMDFGYQGWTASNRHIYDLEDWDRSLGSIVPGQSGMLGSPHYSDQTKLWLNVDHHPLYFSRAKVEKEAKERLILTPVGR